MPTVAIKKGETGRQSPRTPLESMLWLEDRTPTFELFLFMEDRTPTFELFLFMFAGGCFSFLNIELGERGLYIVLFHLFVHLRSRMSSLLLHQGRQ